MLAEQRLKWAVKNYRLGVLCSDRSSAARPQHVRATCLMSLMHTCQIHGVNAFDSWSSCADMRPRLTPAHERQSSIANPHGTACIKDR
jgi:hypothetical protein